MLQDIVSLLRNRGPKILVEGVESEEQMSLLRGLGIDQVQGYHVGRPAGMRTFQHHNLIRERRSNGRRSA
jgi:EAL domain-containing protein (putative c-di-GMP-specific phosphodiesterase class I)